MRPLLLALALVSVAWPAAAQVIVRTTLKPDHDVVIGQHVRLLVDVLYAGGMPRPPRVALPDMPGAQVLRYETQATTLHERVDEEDRIGQRFEFALFPRRGGRLEIPAPQVTLFDRAGGETGRVEGSPVTLDVTVPPGVDPSKPVVATSSLTLTERWQPAPTGTFKAGDALVRTITRQAADIPGMAMLDLSFAAPAGVRVYVDPPQIDDRFNRGDLTGQRTDRATYVFERGGSFPIEAVVQPWWDLAGKRLRQAEGQGVTVAVAAVATPASRDARLALWIYVATTAAGLLALAGWSGPRIRAAIVARRTRWQASEGSAYRELRHACRGGDAHAIYGAFTTWRQRVAQPADLAPFAEQVELAVFAGRPWSPAASRAFADGLAAWRGRAQAPPAAAVLPALNP
ncbi:hypothetical protein [Reyranella sp.]|uniref:hypothetical protein n=1 Tax=Reyranella sp. TaxID=1929291 RepID=UPI003BA8C099